MKLKLQKSLNGLNKPARKLSLKKLGNQKVIKTNNLLIYQQNVSHNLEIRIQKYKLTKTEHKNIL